MDLFGFLLYKSIPVCLFSGNILTTDWYEGCWIYCILQLHRYRVWYCNDSAYKLRTIFSSYRIYLHIAHLRFCPDPQSPPLWENLRMGYHTSFTLLHQPETSLTSNFLWYLQNVARFLFSRFLHGWGFALWHCFTSLAWNLHEMNMKSSHCSRFCLLLELLAN